MPASKSRKGNRWQVCPVCRQIKGRDGYHHDKKKPNGLASWCIACTRARQYEEWRKKRRQQNRAREAEFRERGRKRLEARSLFREDVWPQEITRRLSLPQVTVQRFIADLKATRDQEIARVYVSEEVPQKWLAERFDLSQSRISAILREQGVEVRQSGWGGLGVQAEKPTIGQVLRAAKPRLGDPKKRLPRAGNIGASLTVKGRVVLEILRAAPAPLSIKQVAAVAQGLDTGWSSHIAATRGRLRRLEKHGYVVAEPGLLTGRWGRPVVGWFVPADIEETAPALTEEEIDRQIQIRRLIEQQREDEDRGEQIAHSAAVSLDAAITEDGFTILDTLGAEDEDLAELGAAA